MYSNLGVHGDDPTIAASLGPIFDARDVDMVFQGHNHFYTRTYPIVGGSVVSASQEPSYLNPGAPIYVVTGGAGRFLHGLAAPTPYEATSQSTFHVTSMDVAGITVTLQAIDRDGNVFDAMTLTKDTPVAVAPNAEERHASSRFSAGHASPNPSDGETEIRFTLDRTSSVRVKLFDVAGKLVRVLDPPTPFGPGPCAVRWDGRMGGGSVAPAGLYFARIESGGRAVTARLLRVR